MPPPGNKYRRQTIQTLRYHTFLNNVFVRNKIIITFHNHNSRQSIGAAGRHNFVISKAYSSKRREKYAASVGPRVPVVRARVANTTRTRRGHVADTSRAAHCTRARTQRVRNEETCTAYWRRPRPTRRLLLQCLAGK